jgi:hypothetical protein
MVVNTLAREIIEKKRSRKINKNQERKEVS